MVGTLCHLHEAAQTVRGPLGIQNVEVMSQKIHYLSFLMYGAQQHSWVHKHNSHKINSCPSLRAGVSLVPKDTLRNVSSVHA